MIEIDNILDVEKHLDGIDVVLFDLDDTLYSEKDYVRSGFDSIAKAYPNIKDLSQRLWNAFLNKKSAFDYVLEQEGLTEEKNRFLEIYRNHKPNISLYPGVLDMLIRIRKQKKLGIITDGRIRGQKAKIEALGIAQLFDKIIITDELGGIEFRKPNTKAFVLMKEYFNCDYSKICYVGDNLHKDESAPKLLSILFLFFNNKDGIYS